MLLTIYSMIQIIAKLNLSQMKALASEALDKSTNEVFHPLVWSEN